jgi:hypothetical protein
MPALAPRRLALYMACLVSLAPFLSALPAPDAVPAQYYTGKVVPLAGLIEKFGGRLDADAAPHWLALAADDGKVYPLIKDDGGRMFFRDATLLQRPMRLTGRLLPGSHLLQVVEVYSYRSGQLHEVYYWCDVCSIKRFEKRICECCGGPMELRETPASK